MLLLRLFSLLYPLLRGMVQWVLRYHPRLVVVVSGKNTKWFENGKPIKAPHYFIAEVVKRDFDRPDILLVNVPFATSHYRTGETSLWGLERGWYRVDPYFFQKAYDLPDSFWYGYKHLHGRDFAEVEPVRPAFMVKHAILAATTA